MSGTNIIVLTEKSRSNLRTRGYALYCQKCRELLEIGDTVISKPVNGAYNSKRKYYHFKCWESLFL